MRQKLRFVALAHLFLLFAYTANGAPSVLDRNRIQESSKKALQLMNSEDKTIVIGIAGGSASGKTTIAEKIVSALKSKEVGTLSQDWYFVPKLQPKQFHVNGHPNYDHPSAMDFPLMTKQLAALKEGKQVKDIPDYDFKTAERSSKKRQLGPCKVVIFEGIHALENPELLKNMNLKIFVQLDADVRLGRRIIRDSIERGKDVKSVLAWYFEMVKPMHDTFIEPSKESADLVVPGDLTEAQIDQLSAEMRRVLAPRLGTTKQTKM